ncbi:GntR family transcriptional regulator [Paracoccus sediminilitoris]|uniref:GntR family transcriptional regulator n=1 Tax=Paracoccus sediminilitoris TaxID=2202419 RepID=UPI000DB98D69|nr:GntR family transcriptional regulator [Paracoccus sediminilitoris]
MKAGTEDIASDLRRRILSLELPPGSVLSRSDLTARYGISSTPLRDALLALRDEGLVQIMPQSRTMVSRIDLAHARQIHVLRSAMEIEASRRVAAADLPGVAEELAALIQIQQDQMTRGDMAAFSRLDLAFHEALFRAAGLMVVHQVIRRESIHIDRLRALHLMKPEKAQQILNDHRSIIVAIKAGNVDAAAEAMRLHLSQSILLGDRLTQEKPDYFT